MLMSVTHVMHAVCIVVARGLYVLVCYLVNTLALLIRRFYQY